MTQSTPITSPVMRYHGGKFRLAPWIMQFFPPHLVYVEPFGGAGGVLIQKPRSYSEVYNDLDGEVVNLFRVLRDPDLRQRLIEQLVLTPYSREEFIRAFTPVDDPIESARRIVIRASMGFGSAGATKGKTGFRSDSLRKYGTASHLWAKYPDGLSAIGERLAGVMIENRPALDLIRDQDSVETLFFVDPPYVLGTRCIENSSRYYKHEMTDDDHRELLQALRGVRGMVVLSGYRSEIYDAALADWGRYSTKSRIAAGRGGTIRLENVWINPAASDALGSVRARQMEMFVAGGN